MTSKNSSKFMASQQQHRLSIGLLTTLLLLVIQSLLVSVCRAESEVPEDTRRWSNGVGLWGKRSPSPSVAAADLLDGLMQRGARLVHKRPEDSWHKLNALWGKRSDNSNWQTATGLWGKRSAPPVPPAAWALPDYYYQQAGFWPIRN